MAAVAAGATDGGQSAVVGQYHGLAAPFCVAAARVFLDCRRSAAAILGVLGE
jgi:hypothetical protein